MKLILPDTSRDFAEALQMAAKIGSINTLISLGLVKPYMSLREAYRTYGESSVRRWIKQGAVEKIKQGPGNSKAQLSRLQLEAAAVASVQV